MSDRIVHIIEPTLVSDAGHCSIVVQSLCAAGEGLRFCVWVGREAQLAWTQKSGIEIRPYFSRRLRRLQTAWLYWRLLRSGARLVITTAGRTDLVLLNLVGPKPIPPGRVFLYLHQLRLNPRKEMALRRLAVQQPNLTLMCTTGEIEKTVRHCGFHNTMVVLPLPVQSAYGRATELSPRFRHVLVAGAARSDKGFSIAVDLIRYLAAQGASLPVSIQTSGDHYGRYDEATQVALAQLRDVRYSQLTMLPDTLTRPDYVKLFRGAICLQPYDRTEYANKLSGITLDAFTVGAPVVTLSRTWMAKMVQQFEAGVTVEEPTSEALYRAVETVRDKYEHYSANATQAGLAIRKQNQWASLIDMLKA
jgi:glycosyltransferase involved in cell wall biosynthesis